MKSMPIDEAEAIEYLKYDLAARKKVFEGYSALFVQNPKDHTWDALVEAASSLRLTESTLSTLLLKSLKKTLA